MPDIPYIPYFQTSRYRVATMVELANPKSYELGADLGMGDGRISIAFAKAGIQMHGYELDENLRNISTQNIKKEQLENKIAIFNKDFWFEELSQYNIIACYPMPTIMGRLEKKLRDELQPGTRVVLNYFPFLHWKEHAKKDNVFVYIKK